MNNLLLLSKEVAIYLSSWVIAYFATIKLFSYSLSKNSYGLMSGWWCAIIVSFLITQSLFSGFVLLIIYVVTGILAVKFNWTWFYHDLPTNVSFYYVIILIAGGLLFVSPILLAKLVSRFAKHK